MMRPARGGWLEKARACLGLVRVSHCARIGAILPLCLRLMPRSGVGLAAQATASAMLVCLAAAGYALNDYFDYPADCVNVPGRPLPAGALRRVEAVPLAAVLFVAGNVLAAALGVGAALLSASNTLILVAYAAWSKRMGPFKNVVVLYLHSSVFLLMRAMTRQSPLLLAGLAAYAALSTYSRELIRDIHDVRGDSGVGARTLPVMIGPRAAWRVGFGALLASLAVPLWGWSQGLVNGALTIGMAVAGVAYICAYRVLSPERRDAWIKRATWFEMVALVLGGI